MISVCLATYNGEKYIERQIKSILTQLSPDDEIVISDNESKDNTLKIIEAFNDKRIKIFIEFQNGIDAKVNCIKNFENALNKASGDYIFLSDQDDIWTENKVSISLKYLQTFDVVVSDCNIISDNEEVLVSSYFKRRNSGVGFVKNLIQNSYLGCCMAFKKEVLSIALPFPPSIPMHDIFIGFVGEIFFKPAFITTPLVMYRNHSNNVSDTTVGKSSFGIFQQIMFRVRLLCLIPKLFYRKFFK